ncbi:hypothetical protein BDN72DRAFT_754724 [Pluteus cervinus]|uniref:Uncharacterized protein n=1 Tax=Pluteus cervinus TaxID=181527 RepID=A0ACD3BFZ4_9AGAR|nr:hypothetical protein BDN72DRAFT_754724 [Pluteus cervinus]
MDTFKRPPAIAEDTLVYSLHLPPGSDKASASALATCIRSLVEELLPDFIWHKDPFDLKISKNPDRDEWFLESRMRVGDCADDEWLVVWLLREISAKWDLAIEVFDSDGEFLLIEAAEVLPSWVKPTNSEHRVWIYGYRLHLIPISYVSSPSRQRRRRKLPGAPDSDDEDFTENNVDDDYLELEDAVKFLRDPQTNTNAPPEVEQVVWKRIEKYPAAAREHIHYTKAYIPKDVAKVLSVQPSLIQQAVETFYTRDALQLRAAHRMSRFPPDSSILTRIKMTRTAYAQLMGQKFSPPRVFGSWKAVEGTREWRWRDMGVKIAVGFEMSFQESVRRKDVSVDLDGTQASFETAKASLRNSPEYLRYVDTLKQAGYFKGEVEGSEKWYELESKAVVSFLDIRRDDSAYYSSFASRVATAMNNVRPIPETKPLDDEDSDEWLNVDPAELDAMLAKTMGSQTQFRGEAPEETNEDQMASDQAARLKKLATQVNDFVNDEGDLEGAEFADEHLSDFSDEPSSESEDGMQVEEDTRQTAIDKLVPGLEPGEYGKMPASYHSNSQRTAPATVKSERKGSSDSEGKPDKQKVSEGRPIRQPILPRDKFDGVDSDDETDDEEQEDSEDEEDKPQVVGDMEIDMGEEEQEFLEFSRHALGISDAQWNDILRDRKDRGAPIPSSAKVVPIASSEKDAKKPTVKMQEAEQAAPQKPGENLDNFEAVMEALDAELDRVRSKGKARAPAPPQASTSATNTNEEQDIVAAMEAEFQAAIQRGGEDEDVDMDTDLDAQGLDYNLIKNFLESFKSQGGLSGPVGNLVGRLQPGWNLPRDDA